jgi:hypothetical protein
LIERSTDALASVLVSITNVLDLDQIILAGPGYGAAGQIYVDAAVLGAASLVLHSHLRPGAR